MSGGCHGSGFLRVGCERRLLTGDFVSEGGGTRHGVEFILGRRHRAHFDAAFVVDRVACFRSAVAGWQVIVGAGLSKRRIGINLVAAIAFELAQGGGIVGFPLIVDWIVTIPFFVLGVDHPPDALFILHHGIVEQALVVLKFDLFFIKQFSQRGRLILHIEESLRDLADYGLGLPWHGSWFVFRAGEAFDIVVPRRGGKVFGRGQVIRVRRVLEQRLHHLFGRFGRFVLVRLVARLVVGHGSSPVLSGRWYGGYYS